MSLDTQIKRRRTFAIISHPDAGKTTLTEKLLLYGGALHLAGSVTARKNQRAVTSDWMELEQKRGISITSTALQFEYRDCVINLLDTPGHRDFSEDTYRVLTAVDAAIMVIDAGKGIESQTRKLFEVCRQRGVPIFTFMNKLDRPARDPLSLVDELESVLGIGAYVMNWPLGDGNDFRGVYDRLKQEVHLYERTSGGAYRAPVTVGGINDPFVSQTVNPDTLIKVKDELEMLQGAGHSFDFDAITNGTLTPVFFGSAANNFGVQLLLDAFIEYAPPPQPRLSGQTKIEPSASAFSGFIFKIQANMDPRHRDRICFVRIVSGRFERDMQVIHTRTGSRVRLSNSQKLFAQERETVNEAFPGDVVGIVGNQDFRIGDTLSQEGGLNFSEIPRFAPECFAYLRNPHTSKYKRFREGLAQLLHEGVIQQFFLPGSNTQIPLLGAVGALQFEVVQYRLQTEYNAESLLEPASWDIIRWLHSDNGPVQRKDVHFPTGAVFAIDETDEPVVLFSAAWQQKTFIERNPGIQLLDSARPKNIAGV